MKFSSLNDNFSHLISHLILYVLDCLCFILVLLNHMIQKKVEKTHPQKRLNFRVGSNWQFFNVCFFVGFLSITSFKTIRLLMLGGVLKNSGNLQQDRHKNLQNWWRNGWDNWTQSWQPKKFIQQKLSHFEPPPKSYFFLGWDFPKFFLLIWFECAKMKFRPYFTMELVQKLMKKT